MGRKSNRFKDAQAKRESGGWVPMSTKVLRSQTFINTSAHAVKLLMDGLSGYTGDNNGDISFAWTLMQKRGWKSRDTLRKALTELLDRGWIVQTRQGGRHRASLYAVTFLAIDECPGKDLERGPTATPTGEWKRNEPVPPLNPRKIPWHAGRVNSPAIDTPAVSGVEHATIN